MPRYELMYLLGSHVAETEVSNISALVLKSISDNNGTDVIETQLGKKKLAYPIKKTRNGFYVTVDFNMETTKVNLLDAKVRSMNSSIIRYILINLEEHIGRQAKDKLEQAKIVRRTPAEKPPERIKTQSPKPATLKLEDIDEKTLDEKIERALTEDLTK